MNLVVDIGNSRTKIALFELQRMKGPVHFCRSNEKELTKALRTIPENFPLIVSSVAGNFERQFLRKKKAGTPIVFLNHRTPLPFKIKYKTPETLGLDRIANAAGGISLFPERNVLVVDAGTCLKFDFIDANKNYHGGAISPGLQMRFNSLNYFTENLPLLKPAEKFMITGQSTNESIQSGVQNGMILEIGGVIAHYRKKYKTLKVVLTGGDWIYFVNQLKNTIFAAPELTLIGLNEILNYNLRRASK